MSDPKEVRVVSRTDKVYLMLEARQLCRQNADLLRENADLRRVVDAQARELDLLREELDQACSAPKVVEP